MFILIFIFINNLADEEVEDFIKSIWLIRYNIVAQNLRKLIKNSATIILCKRL